MECTKLNCPMQVGTVTENCGDSCPWRTTVKLADLISRAALLKDLSYCAPELWQDEEYIKVKIMKQHAVDAAPVVHARWVHHEGGFNDHFECTACGEAIVLTGKWRFCPNCGAKMDGDADG